MRVDMSGLVFLSCAACGVAIENPEVMGILKLLYGLRWYTTANV